MKKIYGILIVVGFVFLGLVGCSNDKEVLTTCTLTQTNEEQGFKLNATYNVYSKNDLVDHVVTKEIVTSNTKSILEYYKNYAIDNYDKMNKAYGGYTYSSDMTDNQLTVDTTIDYTKMDLKKFASDNPGIDSYFKDDKITLEGVLSIYKQIGATCEK